VCHVFKKTTSSKLELQERDYSFEMGLEAMLDMSQPEMLSTTNSAAAAGGEGSSSRWW